MPRLLLVDDNPSIHRIAESLLAPTDVDLVCVDSAAEALDRIARGERFDVALVDTAMPGMDGWTLLGRLRSMDETARMPIALMAGVLDPVDPAKLAQAPIQGFLKKPIELRELGDRVMALLATPVVPPSPSPFSTMPATPAKDLVKRVEAALPEFRHEAGEAAAGIMDFDFSLPEPEPAAAEAEEDLLVLTAEDLWPEASDPILPEAPPALPEVHLELEELDLDSLQDLTGEAPQAPAPAALPEGEGTPEAALLAERPEDDPLADLSGLEDLDLLPKPAAVPVAVPEPALDEEDFLQDLPLADLTMADETDFAVLPEPPAPVTLPEDPDSILAAMEPFRAPASPAEEALAPEAFEPEVPEFDVPEPAIDAFEEPAAFGQPLAAFGQLEPAPSLAAVPEAFEAAPEAPAAPVSPAQTQALVQALLADPVLMDALVKGLVARMGDQVLREIAWEVMPDLAERLHQ